MPTLSRHALCVIAPVLRAHLRHCLRWIDPCRIEGVPLVLVLNGPVPPEGCQPVHAGDSALVQIVSGPADPNPYVARNLGVSVAKALFNPAAYVMVDGDSFPADGFFREITRAFPKDRRLAESIMTFRVKTHIPHHLKSLHFTALRATNFECYDGFAPNGSTYGGGTLIGEAVFTDLGGFNEKRVSGGDIDLGERAKQKGYVIHRADDAVVYKSIHAHTFSGIMLKQVIRSINKCQGAFSTTSSLDCVRNCITSLDKLSLAFTNMTDVGTTKEDFKDYSQVVDGLYKLMWDLGEFSRYVDQE